MSYAVYFTLIVAVGVVWFAVKLVRAVAYCMQQKTSSVRPCLFCDGGLFIYTYGARICSACGRRDARGIR